MTHGDPGGKYGLQGHARAGSFDGARASADLAANDQRSQHALGQVVGAVHGRNCAQIQIARPHVCAVAGTWRGLDAVNPRQAHIHICSPPRASLAHGQRNPRPVANLTYPDQLLLFCGQLCSGSGSRVGTGIGVGSGPHAGCGAIAIPPFSIGDVAATAGAACIPMLLAIKHTANTACALKLPGNKLDFIRGCSSNVMTRPNTSVFAHFPLPRIGLRGS